MTDRPFISAYSPQRTEADDLEAMLVQREGLLRESVELIRESVLTDNKHHLLFIGPRGMGKTHLVKLIHHRLSQQARNEAHQTLREKMRFAWLNEDEIATSFLRFLLRIFRSLSERYPTEFPLKKLTEIAGLDADTARERLGQSLLECLGDRTVVLIVENLDALFSALPAAELRTWRAFVQNHPVFATVGTAQALFDGVAERAEPFFGFFDTRHLDSLTVDEARQLLANIARLHPDRTDLATYLQTPQGRSRVGAIRELSGGNPRLFVIFSELFTRKEDLDGLVRPFEEMVDRQLTAYYQERLRWLSPQQREIIQLLSRFRHPVAVKQIAEGLFTSHNTITGQLKQLRDLRYVNARPLGREVYYELAEPLMRLALEVKETDNRRPLALIVDFLRVAFEREELAARLATCDPGSRGHLYLSSAQAANEAGLSHPRHEVLRHQLDCLDPEQCDDATLATVRDAAEDLGTPFAWLKLGNVLYLRHDWPEAVAVFSRVIGMAEATADELATALFRRGYSHGQAGRTEEAIADYSRAIDLPGAPTELVAKALFNRGYAHGDAGRTEEAIADCTRVIDLPSAPAEQVALALVNRGYTHGEAGRTEEAIADYSRAIDLPGAPADRVTRALINRGYTHGEAGRTEEAIADYSRAIDLPGAPAEQVALALVNRGARHGQAGRIEESIADCTRAMELPGAPAEQVAIALFVRGLSHGRLGKPDGLLQDLTALLAFPDRAAILAVVTTEFLPFMTQTVVKAIFAHTTDPQRWAAQSHAFLGYFGRYDGLAQLGDALVQHITTVAKSPLNHAAWDAWVESWEMSWTRVKPTLDANEPDRLDLPLRLLRAGIAYSKTTHEGSLLTLPLEERNLLRKALGLPKENTP